MAVYARRKSRPSAAAQQGESAASAAGRRAKVVWVSFLASMTLVGGVLMLLDGGAVPQTGLSLPPLAAAAGVNAPDGRSVIFQTRKPLDPSRWKAIVIHHSGSLSGSPESIEREHEARSLRGLGHHLIIGNGRGMSDGEVHMGYRWLDQLPGAHAAGPDGDWYNHHAISICLVGDGTRRPFTPAQIRELRELTAAMCRELGIPPERVLLHSQVARVDDPGHLFPATALSAAGDR
ncbi:MAG: N-acetylmuramoyl-L-alanine amidase [Phycisphaeraceae bacterium]|nr:N-acetylmuramoyl-L-alanine amidase [Phycisphaeraceae bacterium]MBX3405488.1 N-acetylmuramoyl-L-alanine amidase [Phycisphaeraceae bacterium]